MVVERTPGTGDHLDRRAYAVAVALAAAQVEQDPVVSVQRVVHQDARALAETMRRACTEEGLWERLAGGISAPPGREVMVEGFLKVYRGEPVRLAAE